MGDPADEQTDEDEQSGAEHEDEEVGEDEGEDEAERALMALRCAQAEALLDRPPPRLAPFVEVVRQHGGLTLYGLPGLEADDLIASLVLGLLVCVVGGWAGGSSAAADGTHTSPAGPGAAPPNPATAAAVAAVGAITIASGDSDMLQLLSRHPGVAWLEIRPIGRASSAQERAPLALRSESLPGCPPALMQLHRAAAAANTQLPDGSVAASASSSIHTCSCSVSCSAGGAKATTTAAVAAGAAASPPPLLPAAAYADYLALVGKPEAGVPGLGLSGRSARRLLARYGSVEELVAAFHVGDAAVRAALGEAPGQPGRGRDSAGAGAAAGGDLLRPTCAWRLGRMQRSLADVAVVPFYDLMLPPVPPQPQPPQPA
ncbi:hypothetical protein GPECTOR_36g89 [Gonium pectorale]|uniref:5'-3' exonuclease domain-containing protein n=1 Tax=Gonium pectorale TaxID=33097 RepID=A0A150GBY3_GONPE|nr:hypothetical protein GPECTOR_36g89 [Gonium pectorale]|eukprot:KXZ47367.1 hypothetical protein GPECTOR_36g89 [Gonium pectorale]